MISTREIILAVGFFIVAMSWAQALGRKGRTTGKIVEFVVVQHAGTLTHKPRIAFKINNVEYSFIPSVVIRGDVAPEKIGKKVQVAYNTHNPKDADLANPWRTFVPPAILTCAYGVILWIVLK